MTFLSCRSMVLAFCLSAFPSLFATGAFAEEPVRCTVLMDVASGESLYREGICNRAFYPMSTFKLPIAVMGYDAGILVDEKTPRWDYQAAFDRPARERKAVDPTIWERDSIVWYSQEVNRRLGRQRFQDYVRRFDYGNGDVSAGSGKLDGLTGSWLMASLKISPDQQVDFIRRLLTGRIEVSAGSVERARAIMPRFAAAGGWEIHGKTGAGWLRRSDGSVDRSRPLGWFVGWAERDGRTIAFARLLVDTHSHDQPISFTTRDSLIADFPDLVP